ncbi:MAG: ribonuclease P protein component [Oscillibacter sp.]|nr:ribonuclease P protein component [Oscillibacter sp.]
MKKRLTLKKNYEFRRLYRKGTTAAGGCMVVYCMRNRLGRSRLGLTASTKLGNAVKRNRARRRLREVFRLNLAALKPGYDVILVARSRTLSASWKELNATFLRLSRKLGMAREKQEKDPGRGENADKSASPEKGGPS